MEPDLADELKQWCDGFENIKPPPPLTLHHDSEAEMFPEPPTTNAVGPPVDPPANPYDPFDWSNT